MSDGIIAFGGNMPRPVVQANIADPASIYCKWAYQIAECAAEMPLSSIAKAVAAFDEWGVAYPEPLARELERRARK